jgi:hypothetical protein
VNLRTISSDQTAGAALGLLVLACSASAAESIDLQPDGGIDFWWRSTTLTPLPSDTPLYFGVSVDMSGDYLAVGSEASAEDGSSLAGRVYVYRRVGSDWQLDASLISPAGAQQGAIFGNSVSIASTADGVVLVVGEPGRDVWFRGNFATDSGAVWLYERVDGEWQNIELSSPLENGALLGFSVDTDGSHVVAGAPGTESNHGGYVVWRRENDAWTVDHTGTALEIGAAVGYSVAIGGDRLLLGAPAASYIGNANAGAALILPLLFAGEPGSSVIFDPTPEAGESFGLAVAATPTRFAVGSIHDDAPGDDPDSGAAHVYSFDGDNEHLVATFRSPAPQEDARFGASLAFAGERLVVGEPERAVFLLGSTLNGAGAIHLFRETTESDAWIHETSLYNFGQNQQMGWSVAADGERVAAGVPTRPMGAQNSAGAVDVFERDEIFADGFD